MRFSQVRCASRYMLQDGNVGRCSLEAGHYCHHEARLSNGLWLTWTDSEAKLSFEREAPPATKRSTPIQSWRAWGWEMMDNPPGAFLKSLSANHEWLSPVATTRPDKEGKLRRVSPKNLHNIGNRILTETPFDHGVYSYKTPRDMLSADYDFGMFTWALGRLENFGHIVEHQWGYRAQKVIVRELWVVNNGDRWEISEEILSLFEDRYQCPVHALPYSRIKGWANFYSGEEQDV